MIKYKGDLACFVGELDCEIPSQLEITPNAWKNQILVSQPPQLRDNTVFLYISSGEHQHEGMHPQIKAFSQKEGTVVAQLRVLTNGPLKSARSNKALSEDHLIASSWKEFFKSQDESVLVQLRLRALVSAAIDLIEEFMQGQQALGFGGVVISGQSKRALLCWMSASNDPRVVGIIPMVYDLLNFRKNLSHHHNVYGFWADALAPYAELGIPDLLDDPGFYQLEKLIDPMYFCSRLQIPKYIINAANDRYFLPDSSQFYYHQLTGSKGLRYLPNHGHRLEDHGFTYWHDVFAAFTLMSKGINFPKLNWQLHNDKLCISFEEKPCKVFLWKAEAKQRDFRIGSACKQFKSYALDITADQGLSIDLASSKAEGWQACFAELVYTFPDLAFEISLTTDIVVSQA